MSHGARDEEEKRTNERQRDAVNLMRLTLLLQGKKQAREDTWRDLVALLRPPQGEPGGAMTKEELAADFERVERDLFGALSPEWADAVRDEEADVQEGA